MRYPLWAFLFIFIMPPFAVHALLSDKASFDTRGEAHVAWAAPAETDAGLRPVRMHRV